MLQHRGRMRNLPFKARPCRGAKSVAVGVGLRVWHNPVSAFFFYVFVSPSSPSFRIRRLWPALTFSSTSLWTKSVSSPPVDFASRKPLLKERQGRTRPPPPHSRVFFLSPVLFLGWLLRLPRRDFLLSRVPLECRRRTNPIGEAQVCPQGSGEAARRRLPGVYFCFRPKSGRVVVDRVGALRPAHA